MHIHTQAFVGKHKDLVKSALSVHLSVNMPACLPVWSQFSEKFTHWFFCFWHECKILYQVKRDLAQFSKKVLGGSVFEKKGAIMVLKRSFVASFESFYCYIFLKFIKIERPYCCWYFSTSLVSDKIPVLELWVKMLLLYQIVGFVKGQYLMSKCEIKLTFYKDIIIKVFCKFLQPFLSGILR